MTVLGAARLAQQLRFMLVVEANHRTKNPHYSLLAIDQSVGLGATIDYHENAPEKDDLSGLIKLSPKVSAIDKSNERTHPGTSVLIGEEGLGILGSLVLYPDSYSEGRIVHEIPDLYMARHLPSFDRSRLTVDYELGRQILRETPPHLFGYSMQLVQHMVGQFQSKP
jgi:hypothetical protein